MVVHICMENENGRLLDNITYLYSWGEVGGGVGGLTIFAYDPGKLFHKSS
jgi:hypothetical protein